MNWFSGLVVYVLLWWFVFFLTLPFGVRPPHEVGEEPGPGHAASAPVKPRLWLKLRIATAVSVVLWLVAYYLITSDLISFRE